MAGEVPENGTKKSADKNVPPDFKLKDHSKVAVVGSGPAGSFFAYFLITMAERLDLRLDIDLYDSKKFSRCGPAGCNYCGGIISESLVQILSTEGINIPPTVAQRGIDSYLLHTDEGSVRIELPLHEKRIAAVYRGGGPTGTKESSWSSFDGFLQEIAIHKGARLLKSRVEGILWDTEKPVLKTSSGNSESYDLIVGAVGVNTSGAKLFEDLKLGYHPPQTQQTYLCEFPLGAELVQKHFGTSMNVFLLNIPRLEFAALIPKGDFVTMCLLGERIDKELVHAFLNTPEVKECFPPKWDLTQSHSCQCFPKINIRTAVKPFADRVVLIGDCAATRLFKDGIGAAYVTAKAAAAAAVFHDVSAKAFEKHYWPICKKIVRDNAIGKRVFAFTRLIQKLSFAKRGIIRLTLKEQNESKDGRHLSGVLWDTFTGSAPYRDIFRRLFAPALLIRLFWETVHGFFCSKRGEKMKQSVISGQVLGKTYEHGEVIFRQGDIGDCMYVVQSGKVEIFQTTDEKEVRLAGLVAGDFFGEMALFEREVRSATVRAQGEARVLTVDKKTLFGRIQADPTIAFHLLQAMSFRLRKLDAQMNRIKAHDRRNWETRPDSHPTTGRSGDLK
jgi:CRP-like cAMP-binding protein/flavin-dependent dehydrogenase